MSIYYTDKVKQVIAKRITNDLYDGGYVGKTISHTKSDGDVILMFFDDGTWAQFSAISGRYDEGPSISEGEELESLWHLQKAGLLSEVDLALEFEEQKVVGLDQRRQAKFEVYLKLKKEFGDDY